MEYKHHIEYYQYPFNKNVYSEMLHYIPEMVADWFAAAMVYEGKIPKSREDWKWYNTKYKRKYKPLLYNNWRSKLLVNHCFDTIFESAYVKKQGDKNV